MRRIIVALLLVLWNEYLASQFNAWMFWKRPSRSPSDLQILFVADPQLIGYQNEPWIIGWLARWDSDRYLAHNYELARRHVQPDYIVFLGDLLDESVIANSVEYDQTVERFRNIFRKDDADNVVYVYGDNDVGGEMEPVYPRLQNRFNGTFRNSLVRSSKDGFLAISSVDLLSSLADFGKITLIKKSAEPSIHLMLSHIPVVRTIAQSVFKTFNGSIPDLIMSAHDHTSAGYIQREGSNNFQRIDLPDSYHWRVDVNNRSSVLELQIPTCSYRMGVQRMGYGWLTIHPPSEDQKVNLDFSILSVPGRYPQIFLSRKGSEHVVATPDRLNTPMRKTVFNELTVELPKNYDQRSSFRLSETPTRQISESKASEISPQMISTNQIRRCSPPIQISTERNGDIQSPVRQEPSEDTIVSATVILEEDDMEELPPVNIVDAAYCDNADFEREEERDNPEYQRITSPRELAEIPSISDNFPVKLLETQCQYFNGSAFPPNTTAVDLPTPLPYQKDKATTNILYNSSSPIRHAPKPPPRECALGIPECKYCRPGNYKDVAPSPPRYSYESSSYVSRMLLSQLNEVCQKIRQLRCIRLK